MDLISYKKRNYRNDFIILGMIKKLEKGKLSLIKYLNKLSIKYRN